MPFWEFQLYVKEIERLVKEENKQQEDSFNQYGGREAMKMMKNPEKMMSTAQPAMPKMNMPSTIKMPTYH